MAGETAILLRMDCGEQTVPIVAAVATGVAEALELKLEPSVRLRTIAVEATANAVTHAYPADGQGPLEVRFSADGPEARGADAESIHVSVTDEGVGCRIAPTGGDPPGLGLPVISNLAEDFTLRSSPDRGTSIDAIIVPDGEAVTHPTPAAPDCCELDFGYAGWLQPVLGRALAAKLGAERVHVDRLTDAVAIGDAIAETLGEAAGPDALPALEISETNRARQLVIKVGPLVASARECLIGGLRSRLAELPALRIVSEVTTGRSARTLITLPI